jgi:hypothetical protein
VNDEEPDVSLLGAELAAAVLEALPGWVQRCLDRHLFDVPAEVIAATAKHARELVEAPLVSLLSGDIDAQRGSPLAIVRIAVAAPTVILRSAGVEPVDRDPFAQSAFPDDLYDLSPATWADLGDAVSEPGLRWSVGKAVAHRKRHTGNAT